MLRRISKLFHALLIACLLLCSFSLTSSAQTGLHIAILGITSKPLPEIGSYNVGVLISVVDNSGIPVKDLTTPDFLIREDDIKVDIKSVIFQDGQPINVVLVVDTSYSMDGEKINKVRSAINDFIAEMGEDNNIALITFNTTVTIQEDFTKNHKTLQERVSTFYASPNQGRCFYDAIYTAIQKINVFPSDQRAIVVITDGIDESGNSDGKQCSVHKKNDLIKLASDYMTAVPIYSIGLGRLINRDELGEISAETGGQSQFVANQSPLNLPFLQLVDHLNSRYLLRFMSVAPSGVHELLVEVNSMTGNEKTSAAFYLPPFPTIIKFITPIEGQNVTGKEMVSLSVAGQENITQLIFLVNGQQVAEDNSFPYNVEIDFSQFSPGNIILTVIATTADNYELARSSIFLVSPSQSLPSPTPTDTPTAPPVASTPISSPKPSINSSVLVLILVGGFIGILVISFVVAFIIYIRKKNREKARSDAWNKSQQWDGHLPVIASTPVQEQWIPTEIALGLLVILQSDDPLLVGQKFEIVKELTSIGRSAVNDIIFAKDLPVSRKHATLSVLADQVVLSEVAVVDENKNAILPRYGTYVNNIKIGPGAVVLKDGDEILLGKRTKLCYMALKQR